MTAAALSQARVAPGRVRSDRWVVGGVAADLARLLGASAGFIRVLLFVAIVLEPDTMWVVYGLTAVLIPRAGLRRPGWSNLVALARFALLFAIPFVIGAGGVSTDELFKSSPAVWVPVGGIAVAGLIALLASGPPAGEVDDVQSRTQVVAALPAVAVAAAVAAGVVLFPGVHWERVLAAGVVALGLLLAIRPRRAAIVPVAVLAGAALLLASAQVELRGGVGDVRVTAPSSGGTVVARRAVGDVVVDVRHVAPGETVTVHAQSGIGDVRVLVPRNADAVADASVGRGNVLPGDPHAGIRLKRHLTGQPSGRRAPVQLRIVAETGIGSVNVERVTGAVRGGEI
jgi:hypothetical protein